MSRTLGCDLPDKIVSDILNDHVPLAGCSPKNLFALSKITAGGLSSGWPIFVKYYAILVAFADACGGRVPHQKKLHRQFVEWLEGQPKLDKSVQWGTLSAVAPRPDDKAKFPTERAINALMALARSEMQYGRTRSAAVQTIVTLGGSSKLSSLERLLKGKQDPDSLGVLEAVKKALTPVVKP